MYRDTNYKKINRNFKGIWIPKEIWLDDTLTIMEKIFFIEIDSLNGKDGCFASNQYFSKFFKLTPGRCSQIINSLEKKNYIKIELFYKGKQIIKRVIRVFNKLKGGSKLIKGGYLENDKDNNTIYNNTIYNKDTSADDEIIPSKENKNLPKINGYIKKSLFDKFYKLYPRKVQKGKALTTWEKICNKPKTKRPKFKELITALKKQKKSNQWKDKQFIPHPSTWLNQKRWLDEIQELNNSPNQNKQIKSKDGLSKEELNAVKRKTIKV